MREPLRLYVRLSLLMFLLYAPLGAFWPLFTLRLKNLGFSPLEIALASAVQAVGSLFAPLFAGQLADRWLSADRCLAIFSILMAGLVWLMAECTAPAELALVGLAFWLLMASAMPLGNTILFAQVHGSDRHFSSVRLWGTVGWMVLVWVVSAAQSYPSIGLEDIFRFAAGAAVVLGCYALTLPRTPPRQHVSTALAPLAALRLLHRRDFAIYFACTFVLFLTVPFATQYTVLLLEALGVSNTWKGPALTIAQVTEVLSLLGLPWMLRRMGQRRVMILGAGAWASSLMAMTIGSPLGLVISGLACNGLFISGFVVAGQVFVNSHAAPDIRASAQALISFTAGAGSLLGYGVSGAVAQLASGAFRPTFAVAALLALSATFVLGVWFHPEPPP